MVRRRLGVLTYGHTCNPNRLFVHGDQTMW